MMMVIREGAGSDYHHPEDLVADSKKGSSKARKCYSEYGAANSVKPPHLDADKNDAEIAQKKASPRRLGRSGAKRGGQRYTEARSPSSWRRWIGGVNIPHYEIGDLVDAEWMGTGWWYPGYVSGKVKSDGEKHGAYHVVFADGDEAHVRGEYLKMLGSPGPLVSDGYGWIPPEESRTKRSTGILPRHVPIANLGAGVGLLYRNLAAFWTQTSAAALPLPSGSWWETGTQYAFQPHLAADNASIAWINGAGGGITATHALQGSDADRGVFFSAAATSSVLNGGERRYGQELVRVLQPDERNRARGQRIFFVA